jgi:hypothetical protein
MNMAYCPFRAQCEIYHFITQRVASLALGWDIVGFQPTFHCVCVVNPHDAVETLHATSLLCLLTPAVFLFSATTGQKENKRFLGFAHQKKYLKKDLIFI